MANKQIHQLPAAAALVPEDQLVAQRDHMVRALRASDRRQRSQRQRRDQTATGALMAGNGW